MKTILIPVERTALTASVLATAHLIGEKFGSYMEGLPLGFGMLPMAVDAMGGVVLPADDWHDQVDTAEAERTFETFMSGRGLGLGAAPGASGTDAASYGWLAGDARTDSFVGEYSRVFDLTVVGRPEPAGPRVSTLEAVLFEGGRPILIAPPTPPTTIGEKVMVAWTGSSETARTVALSMPLLKRAGLVQVLTVPSMMVPGPSGDALVRSLGFHGIRAESVNIESDRRGAGEAMLNAALSRGCDLLVKGAYTQSRLRQMIFGGPTSYILEKATLPVFMAH